MITDFHSHILPCVDDGSASVEESVAMLQTAAQQGVGHIVATPHFYASMDKPERFLKRREKAERELRERMALETGLPRIHVGAEVYYFPGMSDSDVLPELTIGNTGHILVEMPPSPWTEAMYRELEGIYVKRGIVPIVAHIDRYIAPFKTHGIPQRLERMPVLVQANADFFLERHTARMALRMLQKEQIHLLGSDCHNMRSRKPNLGPAVELIRKRLGEKIIQLLEDSEADIFRE